MYQVDAIMGYLDIFRQSFGQKINKAKSKVSFSKNVNHTTAKEICKALGMSISSNLGKYPGVPLDH